MCAPYSTALLAWMEAHAEQADAVLEEVVRWGGAAAAAA